MINYANSSILSQQPVPQKPLFWLGSSLEDLLNLPGEVRHTMGVALRMAQAGGRHRYAKTLRGFRGSSVVELIVDHGKCTFRAVYTVGFREAVYVLHVFQKKSTRGIRTPARDIEQIERRLRAAQEHHTAWIESHDQEQS